MTLHFIELGNINSNAPLNTLTRFASSVIKTLRLKYPSPINSEGKHVPQLAPDVVGQWPILDRHDLLLFLQPSVVAVVVEDQAQL